MPLLSSPRDAVIRNKITHCKNVDHAQCVPVTELCTHMVRYGQLVERSAPEGVHLVLLLDVVHLFLRVLVGGGGGARQLGGVGGYVQLLPTVALEYLATGQQE